MSIKEYREKRNFKLTGEPQGAKIKAYKRENKKSIFVVQKHAASHLHYDFRLEVDQVLKSWAIPKGPSLDPNIKRLAIEVEDHPLEYATFEGTIPAGEYGGGTVMVWDIGHWVAEEPNKLMALKKGEITLHLKGKKLKGIWKLIRKPLKGKKNQWLLFKIRDAYASKSDILLEKPLSVLSKRAMKDIAGSKTPAPHKKTQKDKTSKAQGIEKIDNHIKKLCLIKLAKKHSFPSKALRPSLCTLVARPPEGSDWLHEIKWDGYRILTRIHNGKISFFTRNANDWTKKLAFLKPSFKDFPLEHVILDGELVAIDKKNKNNFQLLQNSLNDKDGVKAHFKYYIFDLLYCQGYDLSLVPLIKRKELLKLILETASLQSNTVIYGDHIRGKGEEVYQNACEMALEGIVSKRVDSHYEQKRSRNWLKIKCSQRQEFVIAGFTSPKGARHYFGSLLLGILDSEKRLKYCGHVGTGFTAQSLLEVYTRLKKLQQSENPFFNIPRSQITRHTFWVKPELMCEVAFTERTSEGILRHPTFMGLRADKKAEINQDPSILSGIRFTHPDNELSIIGTTKLTLAKYYEKIHEYILPHIVNRPLSFLRCSGKTACFYQKHFNKSFSKHIYNIPIREKEDKADYLIIKGMQGLLSLIQYHVLEIHPWGSQADKPEKPDRIVFDLDPDISVPWPKLIDAAYKVHAELENIGLKNFLKTTGGKGLHVIVPILRRYTWLQAKTFSERFALHMTTQYPKLFTKNPLKKERVGKIFIDYLRNNREATAIAPYSTRARKNAPIATPLTWQELKKLKSSDIFNIYNIEKRLIELKTDPWQGFFDCRQALPNHF